MIRGIDPRLMLAASSVLAAVGQILLKLGASGNQRLLGFLNLKVGMGLTCYVVSAGLWIWALADLPLSRTYPFTVLTFVLVYLGSVLVLGEKLSYPLIAGVLLVCAGLLVIVRQ